MLAHKAAGASLAEKLNPDDRRDAQEKIQRREKTNNFLKKYILLKTV